MSNRTGWGTRANVVPALSIQQPFAEAILAGKKTIEVRTWTTAYRGPLVIHAGRAWYGERFHGKAEALRRAALMVRRLGLSEDLTSYLRGALVGVVELVDCFTFTPDVWESARQKHCVNSAWGPDFVGWTLANPRRLDHSIPYRGALGLFPVAVDVIAGADMTQ